MIERIRVMVRKELIQALREPRLRMMLVLPPVMQLIIFGYAANMDVERAKIAWMDSDRTQQSREFLSRLAGSGRFEIVGEPEREAAMQRLLDAGTVDAVVRVMPGFGADIARGRQAEVQLLVDGSNSNKASIVAGYATQAAALYSRDAMRGEMGRRLVGRTAATGGPGAESEDSAAGLKTRPTGGPIRIAVGSVKAQTRVWFNPDLKSRNYFVPGVLVNIIMLITLSLTSMAIVREKEIGTMEQLMVTPIRPGELMLGKTLPFVGVGLFDAALAVTVALVLFKVPFRGSFLELLLACVLFLMTTLGAGLFISTISRTQQQAMMSTFMFFMPAFLLSGFSFPIRNMPEVVQWITYLNPIRYFLDIVRVIFLKGAGVEVLWPQMLALAGIGVAVLGMSTLRFRKKLE